MNENEILREQMWDLVYGLLSADEVAALHKQIKSDPAAARLYAEVRLQADLVASAAKVEDASVTLSVPDEARKVQPAAKIRGGSVCASPFTRPVRKSSRAPSYRLANAITATAATALVALIGYGFFGSRQPGPVAADNLVVAEFFAQTPMPSGLTQSAKVRSSSIEGEPVSAPVAYQILDNRGDVVERGQVRTDAAGEAQLTLPGPAVQPGNSIMLWFANAESSPLVKREDEHQSDESFGVASNGVARFVIPLPAQPEPATTDVSSDKDVYQPGDSFYFRAHSMGAFSKQRVPVTSDWTLVGPDGSEHAPQKIERAKDSSVVLGKFQLPADAPPGPWRLVEAGSQPGKPVTRTVVPVAPESFARGRSNELQRGGVAGNDQVASAKAAESKSENAEPDLSRKKSETRLAMSSAAGGRAESVPPPAPAARDLAARAPRGGEPLQQQDKRSFAEADRAGITAGASSPLLDEEYKELGQQNRQAGQEKTAVHKDALDLKVPSHLKNKRLLVVASKEETQVGRQEYDGTARAEDRLAQRQEPEAPAPSQTAAPLSSQTTAPTPDDSEQLPRITLALPPEADGELNIDYFDRSSEPPKLVESQKVYRPGSRSLNVQMREMDAPLMAEQNVLFKIQVTNHKGEEVPGAFLGARLVAAGDLAERKLSPPQGVGGMSPESLSLEVLGKKRKETSEEQSADAEKAALGQVPPGPRAPADDASAAGSPAERSTVAGKSWIEYELLQKSERGAVEGTILPELPRETLLASNDFQVQAEASRREQARESESAAFRQLVARLLLVMATLTLLILGVLAILRWSAQVKYWAPAMAVVAASFIVGCIWLMNGPFPAANQTAVASKTDLRTTAAKAPRNQAELENRADPSLPDATEPSAGSAPAVEGGKMDYSFKDQMQRQDGARSPDGAAPVLSRYQSRGGGFGGGDTPPVAAGSAGRPLAKPSREEVRMRRDSPLSLPEAERSLAASPAEPKPADKESRDGAESTFGEGKLKQQDENVDKGRNRELSEKLSETKSKTGAALKGVKDADRFEKLEASDRPRSSSPPLLWEHLAADEKGEAEIDLKLPSEPGEYWLMIDAYGPGGVGKLQKRLLVRVPPATGAGPAGLPAPATEVKPE